MSNNQNALALVINLASKPQSVRFNLFIEFLLLLTEIRRSPTNADKLNELSIWLNPYGINKSIQEITEINLIIEYQALVLLLSDDRLTESYPYKSSLVKCKELLNEIQELYPIKIFYCGRSLDDLNYDWQFERIEKSYLLYQEQFDFSSDHLIMEF